MQRQKALRRVQPIRREQLSRRRTRSLNGTERITTAQQIRNMLVIDLGEDEHGIREALRTKGSKEGRSISSIVREILRRTLVDFQVK